MMTTVARSQVKEASQVSGVVRIVVALALSVVSGVMLLLAFPPYGVWPLMWIAFVPYLLAQHRLLPTKWSSLAPAIALLIWMGPFMARLFGMQFGPVFPLLGVLIALIAFLVNRERRFHELTHYRWFVPQGVLVWVGFEMLRATLIPLVATSALVGYSQAVQPWVTQPVSVFGLYSLNLLIMLVNYALAQGVMAWFDRRWGAAGAVVVEGRTALRWLVFTGIITVAWFGVSVAILGSAPKDAPAVRVAAVQPNYQLAAFQDESTTSQMRFDAFAQDARAAAAEGAQIIYTPEMLFNFDPQVEFTEEFRALAGETGAHIFLTYSIVEEGQPFRNEAVLLAPSGEFSEVYAKNHAPPGEPLSPTAGRYPVYDTPLGRLATLICHDGNYTDVARKLARNGSQLTAAALNEFGGFGEQYWTHVTFRAVENRVAMVVTGRQTGSAIIDPYGRQLALNMNLDGEKVTLLDDVALGSGNTPYQVLGDWMGWIALAGWVFFAVFQSLTTRRAKKITQS
jgi:apolipoprotein N-acyltransferase